MVKFGKYMKTVYKPQWKDHYIDYNKIKKEISQLKRQEQIEIKTLNSENIHQTDSWTESTDPLENMIKSQIGKYIQLFLISIEYEIKKFFRFYLEVERDIYLKLNTHLHNKYAYQFFMINNVLSELNHLEKLIYDIMELARFINLNLTAIRKIFKKFDKKFNLKNNPIALYYLKNKLSDSSSHLVYILQFKIIDESSALIELLIKNLEEIYERKRIKLIKKNEINEVEGLLEEPLLKEMDLSMISGDLDAFEVDKKLKQKFDKLKEMNEKIDASNNLIRSNSDFWRLNSLKEGYSIKSIEKYKDAMVEYIQEENILHNLIPQVDSKYGFRRERVNLLNIWLILIHTFLYMLNCFIVQPTNSDYIKRLNFSPFLTGFVLSMTPLAAIFSTFFYSNLKNTRYKFAYNISLLCFIAGNFFYSFSDYIGSFYMMVMGRILVGLGGARVVNRRYIIEEVPEQFILNYSLWYIVMLSIGMAAGPGFAMILNIVPDFSLNGVNFNIYTNPGWLCVIIWILFYILMLALFEEVENQKNLYKTSDADLSNGQLLLKEIESIKYSEEINKINDDFTTVNLVSKDIKMLISDEENKFSYISIAFYILGSILFIIRMTTECLFVLLPLIMPYYYGSSYFTISLYSCIISLLVLPMSLVFNYYSKNISERRIIKIIIILCVICCCGLIRITLWEISFLQFLIFYSGLFISASLLESVDSSLLAKILPNNNNKNFSKFINPGIAIILTTTSGRFMGSLLVSIFGIYGFESIQNITLIFFMVLYGVAYTFVFYFYNDLRVKAICRIIKKNN